MGVPGFFAWLVKNYNRDIIINEIHREIDNLYIDANCLFHPQCFKVLAEMKDCKNESELEKNMMDTIIKYMDYIIKYVDPKKMIYISVDGVAPMAKINQQRKRRFKGIQDNIIKNNIKKKWGQNTGDIEWSNTVITPGTKFMELLHLRILLYIKQIINVEIIYSSYHTSGEGEHKILSQVRKRKDDTSVIYGLDADLIFLALSSGKNNMYLLRESHELNKIQNNTETFNYVSIDILKICVNEKISIYTNTKGVFIKDFIFICYLLGNDFMPHIPSLDIKTGGLEILLKCYGETYNIIGKNIIETDENINMDFLRIYIQKISNYEHYYFKNILPNYIETHKNKQYKSTNKSDNDVDKEIWKFENLIDYNEEDTILLGKDAPYKYKYRYYNHYFGMSDYQENGINEICEEYCKGLIWTTKYYFKGCASWKWQYPYTHGPFVSDIYGYICGIDLNNIKFGESNPLAPFEQLIAVLPPSCKNLLPESYRELVSSIKSPIIDYYPNDIAIDILYKDVHWKSIPIIPTINIDKIIKCIKNKILSKEETERNKLYGDIINI